MLIDYHGVRTFEDTFDIVDPGNTCIRCTSYEGAEYYIVIRTVAGQINFLSFGPVLPDVTEILVPDFNLSYTKFKWNERKLEKAISSFVNDPKKKISELEEVAEYEGFSTLPQIEQGFMNA